MTYRVKSFGNLKPKRFTPPKATRGGYTDFFARTPEKPLTGQINGLKAAKGEERLSRAIDKGRKNGYVLGYYFRSSPGIPKGDVGWLELDFEIQTVHGTIAVSVKGADFVHRGESKKNEDKLKEIKLLDRLRRIGRPVPKIETVFDYELKTQADADKVARKLGIK